jgi:Tol biopolymer transport system component
VAVVAIALGAFFTLQSRRDSTGADGSPAAAQTLDPTVDPTADGLPRSATAMPDDQVLTWTSGDGTQPLQRFGTDDKGLTQLSDGPAASPLISKDRRTIVFLAPVDGRRQLRAIAADGHGVAEPVFPGGSIPQCPAPRRPAWHSETNTFVLTCVEKNKQRSLYLASPGATDEPRRLVTGYLGDPAFTPDGKAVVYWQGTSKKVDGGSLYLLDLTDPGAAPQRLTRAITDNDPAVSPKGGLVAFRRNSGPGVQLDLRILEIDAQTSRGQTTDTSHRLTRDSANDENPTWSPDGKRIGFTCDGGFCVMRADGEKRRTVLTERVQAPQWSPR